ncbi:MAG: hypothetical protein R2823_04690 [Acidimicrobiia bacterium]
MHERQTIGRKPDDASPSLPRWSVAVAVAVIVASGAVLWLTTGQESPQDGLVETRSVTTSTAPPTTEPATTAPATTVTTVVPYCETVTRAAVSDFFTATARGDAEAADAVVSVEGFIRFIEPPLRVDDDARDRATLFEYLSDRFDRGARLVLVDQDYHGGTGDRVVNFGVEVRNEDDATLGGIGRVNCETGEMIELVLTAPVEPDSAP